MNAFQELREIELLLEVFPPPTVSALAEDKAFRIGLHKRRKTLMEAIASSWNETQRAEAEWAERNA